jgi:CRISPR-associated protein Cmr6
MSQNLHKFYFKDYFKDIDFSYLLDDQSKPSDDDKGKIEEKNKLICGEHLLFDKIPTPYKDDIKNTFQQEIQYPGLVTGVGIKHETGITGEFKLGVHFDWTYGMPVVYGSSVKGVLRAWFKEFYKPNDNDGIDEDDLIMDIFAGSQRNIEEEKKRYKTNWAEKVKDPQKRIYENKSIYDRDIFFDAVLVKEDKKWRILCSDSITPHLKGPLKNPIPITFLKIAPGCTIEFRFKLVKSIVNGKPFDEKKKKLLFKEILTTIGVGAKTNVGYGQLKPTE